MRNWIFCGLIVTTSLLGSPVQSADTEPETPLLQPTQPMNPDDLYEIALRHNPDLLKTVKNAELSAIGLRSAWGTLLPSVDVGYQLSQNEYYLPTYVNPDGSVASYPKVETYPLPVVIPDPTTGLQWMGWDTSSLVTVSSPVPEGKSRSSSGYISVRETIRLGGQQLYAIRNAKISSRMNDLQVETSRQSLRLSIRQNYYNVLAQKRLLDLARQLMEQKQEQLRLARARYEIGAVTELDVLQAEIDVGNQQNAIITSENNLKLAREELNRILGVGLSSQYELVEDFTLFTPTYGLDQLVNQARATRPDYQWILQQETYQKNLARSYRGEFFPNLTASLTHSRSQNSGGNVDFTFNPKNHNTSVEVGLSWNLFSGFADQAQYETSRVALKNAGYDRKNQELSVEKEVRAAYYALQQTYDQSKVMQQNRELASRQLALEQERYRLGATSQLNLRVAQVTYEQAEANYITNVFSFWSNLATLEMAVGQKLH